MVKRGTSYVPTIDHNRYYVDAREEFKYDDEVIAGLNAYIEKNLETARRAHVTDNVRWVIKDGQVVVDKRP